jgi:hypothetical protein
MSASATGSDLASLDPGHGSVGSELKVNNKKPKRIAVYQGTC